MAAGMHIVRQRPGTALIAQRRNSNVGVSTVTDGVGARGLLASGVHRQAWNQHCIFASHSRGRLDSEIEDPVQRILFDPDPPGIQHAVEMQLLGHNHGVAVRRCSPVLLFFSKIDRVAWGGAGGRMCKEDPPAETAESGGVVGKADDMAD
ncbi:uncharacterized protein EI97DRAFT_263739 [Westerdykella ornata]|uniref:Uncharacterized protein n=1 Tax=Westerdykella ornata TaxID=318751 RepID=A0A6A6J4T4_WESOR|nr:uncharacterized protein EI97DRAFT_263739 [Westerdykella ornata]KAF2271590.1 hypothetical protein EI97DRAFT_263739 [Westerdykella ornata]